MRIVYATVVIVGAVAVLTLAPSAAHAQTSRCADCHIANQNAAGPTWSGFAQRHLDEWEFSPHSRRNVGCEKCHGGDASTFEKFPAHQNILLSRSPASPVNRTNLPKTCGVCHTGAFVSFQKSKHYQLLQQGDDRGPTCSTCHGEVGAYLLSPASLETQCNTCHGPGRPQARPERAASARLLMTDVRTVRASLKEADSLIKRVKDKALRARFEAEWQQAEVPLIEARNAGHEFVFDNLKERLDRARTRVDALMESLANR